MTELLTFQSGAPRKGNGPPSSATGSPGDLYLDIQNWFWYGPKTPAGEWGEGVPAQGKQGEPGAKWRGSYSAGQPYDVNDLVEYEGSVYISLAQQTGANPLNGEWELFASKGDKGDEGPDAYEVAVAEGFSGTRQEWLDSLQGPQGEPGEGIPAGGSVGQVVGKIGAGDYETGWIDPASGYGTDGSTPLKYSAFLAEYGDHQLALQNALSHLYTFGGDYNLHLDLEGARITLTEPVVAPVGASFQLRSISNGEILAGGTFTGSHLFKFIGTGRHHLRWHNVTLIGSNIAGWIEWDDGDFMFSMSAFRHNSTDGTPGLNAVGNAHYHIRSGNHFTCSDGGMLPTDRQRIAVYGSHADNKVDGGNIFSYFRHAIVNAGTTFMADDIHIFQGVSGGSDTTAHTAGIKLTGGYAGSNISNFYLDKCFVEISNEHNSAAASIGGLTVSGVKTLLNSAETNFAFFVVRDYHAKSNLICKGISIQNANFSNFGTALAYPTKIATLASFDFNNFDAIHMSHNTFEGNVQPQANPATVAFNTTTVGTAKQVIMPSPPPFNARTNLVLSVVAQPSSGTPGGLYIGNINRASHIVNVNSSSAWAGTLWVTATVNQAVSGGFVAS